MRARSEPTGERTPVRYVPQVGSGGGGRWRWRGMDRPRDVAQRKSYFSIWGLPLITYAPRGRGGGGGQASYTFPLCMTCKKGGRGSRKHVKLRT